ncbi:MAG TPA: hypothetical protein ENK31_08780 [Nannocystis exedens]|nr:hypothetical protein [Nannocystis exedens]
MLQLTKIPETHPTFPLVYEGEVAGTKFAVDDDREVFECLASGRFKWLDWSFGELAIELEGPEAIRFALAIDAEEYDVCPWAHEHRGAYEIDDVYVDVATGDIYHADELYWPSEAERYGIPAHGPIR